MLLELQLYIKNWQKENDSDFKSLPIDNHSKLIFNHKNEIIVFIFSNKTLRDKCKRSIPLNLTADYDLIVDQEDGFTYYKFT